MEVSDILFKLVIGTCWILSGYFLYNIWQTRKKLPWMEPRIAGCMSLIFSTPLDAADIQSADKLAKIISELPHIEPETASAMAMLVVSTRRFESNVIGHHIQMIMPLMTMQVRHDCDEPNHSLH